jgi:hypothetical protein
VCMSMSAISVSVWTLETLLPCDVDFHSTYKLEVSIMVSLLSTRAHSWLIRGRCLHSQRCVGVGVSVFVEIEDASPSLQFE